MKPVTEQAADWLVRKTSGLTPPETAAFLAWLETPAHAAAFREAEAGWQALNAPRLAGQSNQFTAVIKCRRKKRQLRIITTLAAACIALLFILPFRPSPTPAPTVAVRPDRQVLPDGSVVELNAGAQILPAFTPAERRVRLVQGEALFAVAKNPTRPFIVSAGSVEIRAIGTAFSVRHGTHDVSVVVTEGRVAVVQPQSPTPEPVYVDAGHAVVVQATTVTPSRLDPARLAAELAWRGQRVEFTDTPLREAVALFNGRNTLQLEVGDPALDQIRLNGLFWADDPEAFCRLLADGMNVQLVRNGNRVMLRER